MANITLKLVELDSISSSWGTVIKENMSFGFKRRKYLGRLLPLANSKILSLFFTLNIEVINSWKKVSSFY